MVGRHENRIGITEENFGDLLIQGLQEAHDVIRGVAERHPEVLMDRVRTRPGKRTRR